MVQFGATLLESRREDWKGNYIDYHVSKRKGGRRSIAGFLVHGGKHASLYRLSHESASTCCCWFDIQYLLYQYGVLRGTFKLKQQK